MRLLRKVTRDGYDQGAVAIEFSLEEVKEVLVSLNLRTMRAWSSTPKARQLLEELRPVVEAAIAKAEGRS